MQTPEDLRYSREHEWVAVDGDRARVGITDYAQESLGDIVHVELPEVGATVTANASVAEVDSTKAVSDIYTPVSGTIAEVNNSLADAPEVINSDPYGAGWIFVVELSDPSEVDELMDAGSYQAYAESE